MNKTTFPRIYLYKQIVEAKLYIDSNFEEKLSLENIANHACFSKYHFHRTFKECYGKTPLEYLTYLRMKNAKVLLASQLSTKEVCDRVGYESVSSFVKLFKKMEGVTPSAFSHDVQKRIRKTKTQPLDYIPIGYAEYLGWNNI